MSKNADDIAWCLNNGATSTQWNTAWMEALIANGATPAALPDMKLEFFASTYGYTGSLPDMERQWIEDGRPDAVSYDYNGTVLIKDLGSTFYGTQLEADFTPSDSCGLPLLITARYNSFIGFTGNTIRLATSGNEALYASVEVTIPEYSETPFVLTLDGARWAATNASLYTWMQTQVGNTVGFQVIGTPA